MPALKVPISSDEIIEAVKKMKKHDREAFIEDLLAITSPEYLQSIKEARAEYKAGKTKSHKEIFGE
jgi:PHD/YefM family antitoxin component YafN of YafNO toxin-antitoxin module